MYAAPATAHARARRRPQVETIRSNVIGCLNLADVTAERGLHMTYYGTGCIFHYDDAFPQGSGRGFTEADAPNFTGSYYSYTKARARACMRARACAWHGGAAGVRLLQWPRPCVFPRALTSITHPRA
jgi:nucleoside-diphosphate-sugar epimerase